MSASTPESIVVPQGGNIAIRYTYIWKMYASYFTHMFVIAPLLFYFGYVGLRGLPPYKIMGGIAFVLATVAFISGAYFANHLHNAVSPPT